MPLSKHVLVRNNVQVVGTGSQTLVFAHGFGTDQTAWQHQVTALAPYYRIVLFDHVGMGHSLSTAYSPERYRTLAAYAEDMLEVLEVLNIGTCSYVGHSVSGMMGVLAALVEPERFERCVLLSASPRYLNDPPYIGGFEQADLNELYQAMESNYATWVGMFAPLTIGNPERLDLGHEFARTLAAMRPDIARNLARVIFQCDYRAVLPRMNVPTLLLQAQFDSAVPMEVAVYLAQELPRSELRVLQANGHLLHMSAPEIVTAAIQEFLAG